MIADFRFLIADSGNTSRFEALCEQTGAVSNQKSGIRNQGGNPWLAR